MATENGGLSRNNPNPEAQAIPKAHLLEPSRPTDDEQRVIGAVNDTDQDKSTLRLVDGTMERGISDSALERDQMHSRKDAVKEDRGDADSVASGGSGKTLPTVSSVGTAQVDSLLRLRTPGTYFPPTPGTIIRPMQQVYFEKSNPETKFNQCAGPRLKLRFPPANSDLRPALRTTRPQHESQSNNVSGHSPLGKEARLRVQEAFRQASVAKHQAQQAHDKLMTAQRQNKELSERFSTLEKSLELQKISVGRPEAELNLRALPPSATYAHIYSGVEDGRSKSPDMPFDVRKAVREGEERLLSESSRAAQGAIQALTQKMKLLDAQLKEAKHLANRRASTIAEYERRFTKMQCDIKLSTNEATRERDAAALMKAELETQIAHLSRSLREERKRNESVQKGREGTGGVEKLEKENKDLSAQVRLLQSKLMRTEEQNHSLLGTITSLESRCVENKQLQMSEKSISEAVAARFKAQAEADDHMQRAKALAAENRRLRAKVTSIENSEKERNKAVQGASKATHQLKLTTNQLDQAKEDCISLRERVGSLQADKSKLELQVREQRGHMVELHARLEERESAGTKPSAQTSKLVDEMLRLQKQLEKQRVETRRLRQLLEAKDDNENDSAVTPHLHATPITITNPTPPTVEGAEYNAPATDHGRRNKGEGDEMPAGSSALDGADGEGFATTQGGDSTSKILEEFKNHIQRTLDQLRSGYDAEQANPPRIHAPTASSKTLTKPQPSQFHENHHQKEMLLEEQSQQESVQNLMSNQSQSPEPPSTSYYIPPVPPPTPAPSGTTGSVTQVQIRPKTTSQTHPNLGRSSAREPASTNHSNVNTNHSQSKSAVALQLSNNERSHRLSDEQNVDGAGDNETCPPLLAATDLSHDVLVQAVDRAAQQAKLRARDSRAMVVATPDTRTEVKQMPISVKLNLRLNDKAISRISNYVVEKARGIALEQAHRSTGSKKGSRVVSVSVQKSKESKGGDGGSVRLKKSSKTKAKSKKKSASKSTKRRSKSVSFVEPYKSERAFYGHNTRAMPESLLQQNRDHVLKAAESLLDASYIRKSKKPSGRKSSSRISASTKSKKSHPGKAKGRGGGGKGLPLADR